MQEGTFGSPFYVNPNKRNDPMTNIPADKPEPAPKMVEFEITFFEKFKMVEFEITGTHKLEGTPYRYVFTSFYENKL